MTTESMNLLSCKDAADRCKEKGKWQKALSLYEKISEKDPSNWKNYVSMGDTLLNLRNWEAAAKTYRKALELKSDFDWGWHNLSVALAKLGQWEEVEKCHMTLSRLKPSFWDDNSNDPLVVNHYSDFSKWKKEKIRTHDQSRRTSQSEENYLIDDSEVNISESDIRLIAFYLPQFHPIPENNEWWGKGFTEWTNVTKAKPLFEGHYQPHLPADLGFYDLRLPEVRQAQAELARKYGIYGFCYYYYWFSGKRLLERPLDDMLGSGEPDFPFCLCWANENWSRRWDGAEHEVLMAQEHSSDNDAAFAESLVPYLKDKRYIRVNHKPLLLIYRPSIIPDIEGAVLRWREIFRQLGVGEVFLCGVLTFGLTEQEVIGYGFDAAVQFPPHGVISREIEPATIGFDDCQGKLYDFRDVVNNSLSSPLPNKKLFYSVMTAWDNTARKRKSGNVFLHSSPALYEMWLRGSIEKTLQFHQGEEKLIFINAWNEWAEGTHLEPDAKYGHDFLLATSKALYGTHSLSSVIGIVRHIPVSSKEYMCQLADSLEERIRIEERSFDAMLSVLEKLYKLHVKVVDLRISSNYEFGHSHIESPISGIHLANSTINLSGWIIDKKSEIAKVKLFDQRDNLLSSTTTVKQRKDVLEAYPDFKTQYPGFFLQYLISDPSITELKVKVEFSENRTVDVGFIRLKIDKEPTRLPIKLRKQVKWDTDHRNDVDRIVDELRNALTLSARREIVDELDIVLENRADALSALIDFVRIHGKSVF